MISKGAKEINKRAVQKIKKGYKICVPWLLRNGQLWVSKKVKENEREYIRIG